MGLLEGFAWTVSARREGAARACASYPSAARLVPGTATLLTTQRGRHTGVVVEPSDVRGDEVRAGEDYEPSGVAGTWIATFAAQ